MERTFPTPPERVPEVITVEDKFRKGRDTSGETEGGVKRWGKRPTPRRMIGRVDFGVTIHQDGSDTIANPIPEAAPEYPVQLVG